MCPCRTVLLPQVQVRIRVCLVLGVGSGWHQLELEHALPSVLLAHVPTCVVLCLPYFSSSALLGCGWRSDLCVCVLLAEVRRGGELTVTGRARGAQVPGGARLRRAPGGEPRRGRVDAAARGRPLGAARALQRHRRRAPRRPPRAAPVRPPALCSALPSAPPRLHQ